MAAKSLIPLLVAMMLITGCANTLFTKYQDNQCVSNCSDPNPSNRKHFEQPVIQTAQMFIGEMGCWLVVGLFSLYQRFFGDAVAAEDQGPDYHAIHEDEEEADEESLRNPATRVLVKDSEGRLQLKGWKVAMLALPATCDILGTTLMNAGFLFVVASVYQMTRGMLVIWVGIFSVVFLKKKLYLFQWCALATVVLGVTLVGLAGSLQAEDVTKPASVIEGAKNAAVIISRAASTPDAISTMIGVFLIAGAQIFTATQFVLEEFILEKYALEPLRVVGWEGIFGFTFTALGMLVLHLAIGRTEEGRLGYFDAVEGLRQVFHNRQIAISSILIMISIGGFNFFGLSVTRSVSATSRSTIDTCRTLFIWIVSLSLGWERLGPTTLLQVAGFCLLVYGTFLFNGIVQPPLRRCMVDHPVEELLPEEPIEHL
ncbi:hypothetical protein V492_05449 [Pseudogymnoascus sp. VKM F-4246]|nr:hypothetical protein V492_05449 [Pseudogymnoascus sp. VKM F-4246]